MSFLFCPNCGPVDVTDTHVVEREETAAVRGEPITTFNAVRLCNSCDSTIFDRDLDGANIRSAYEMYRERHRLVSPDEIAAIRKMYGLSQRGLAMLLGLGIVTINRYESGSLPDEAYSHLLRFLKEPRNMRAVFEAHRVRLSPAAQRKTENRLNSLMASEREAAPSGGPRQRVVIPEAVVSTVKSAVRFVFSPRTTTADVEMHDWDHALPLGTASGDIIGRPTYISITSHIPLQIRETRADYHPADEFVDAAASTQKSESIINAA